MTRPSAAPGDDRPRGLLHATWLRIGLGLAAVLVSGVPHTAAGTSSSGPPVRRPST